MPNPASNPNLARMLKRASRPDLIRWQPLPVVPESFVKRFPELRAYYETLTKAWNESESATRRALEAIPDATITEETLSETEIREIIHEMIGVAGDSFITQIRQEITNIINNPPPSPGGGGGPGRPRSYLHTQSVPSKLWVINHNLGSFPDVLAMDTAGLKFLCDILYIDENWVHLLHTIPIAGTALLTI